MNSPAKRCIVIGIDGASMELVKNLVSWGHLPNIRAILDRGVHRPMVGVFPTLTTPGWTSLATGSWHGTHEIMDWTIRVKGEPLSTSKWGIDTRYCKSEYIWNVAERSGKRPILIKYEMSWPPTMKEGIQVEGSGPGVSNYHQIAGYHLFVDGQWAPRPIGGAQDPETIDPSATRREEPIDRVSVRPVEKGAWSNLPQSNRPCLAVDLTVRPLARGRPILDRGVSGTPKGYYGLIYASGSDGYDRVRVCRSRDANDQLTELSVGQWSPYWIETFEIDGAPVEGYVGMKLVSLTASADVFELFVPQVWPREGYTYPPEIASEIDQHVGNFLQNPGRDALGQVDDDTYFELLEFHHQRMADVAGYLAENHPWDLLMLQTHASDYANHFFMGQADEISGAPSEVVQRCRDGLVRTYSSIDRMIARLTELADEDTLIAIASDHGGTPNRFKAVEPDDVLEKAGLLVYMDEEPEDDIVLRTPGVGVPGMVPSNVMEGRREVDWSKSRVVAYGVNHIFVNLKGREPNGIVEPEDYEKTVREVIDALMEHKDADTGRHPFSLALSRSDAEMIDMRGDVTGDVVYAVRPEFDAVHGRQLPVGSYGIGGQHSTFILTGPGVRRGVALQRQVRVVDVAPTLCYLLGWPMPRNVEGGIIYEALEDPDWHLTERSTVGEQ